MLTAQDKEEIKRLVTEVVEELRPEALDGRTHVTYRDPDTDERISFYLADDIRPLIELTARATEVLGSYEKAMRWLRTPVRILDGQSPVSLLSTPEGIARVQDTLGQVEHGVW